MSGLLQKLASQHKVTEKDYIENPTIDFNAKFFVSDMVNQEDSKPVYARIFNEYISVSDLIKADFCPRKYILARKHYSAEHFTEKAGAGNRIIWRMGRAVETHVREQFINRLDFKHIFGKWSCLCGTTTQEGEYLFGQQACLKCGKHANDYNEFTLFDHYYGVSGNPDLLYKDGDGKMVVVEIKSIKATNKGVSTKNEDAGFLELKEAKIAHKYQALAYQKLLKVNGYQTADYVRVVYAAKDALGMKEGKVQSPYKEFIIEYDSFIDNTLDELFNLSRQVQQYLSGESSVLPSRIPQCMYASDKIPSMCKCSGLCFNFD